MKPCVFLLLLLFSFSLFSINDYYVDLPPKLIRAEYLMKVHLQPLGVAGLDRSDVPQGLKLSEVSVSPDLGNLIADYNSQKRIAHTQHEGNLLFFLICFYY